MKVIIQSVSALVLGFSSLAFTGAAQADSGLRIIYTNHGYGHHSYPVRQYYSHAPVRYGHAGAVKPRHHHKHDYGYGHRKHDLRHDKHAYRDHDRGHKRGHKRDHRDDHDRRSHKRDDSRRNHTGYARINRY